MPVCLRTTPRRRGLICLFVGLLALGGCASQSRLSEPLPNLSIPTSWASDSSGQPAGAASLARWWEQLHDPQLTRLVAQALQNNTDVRSAQAALRQARALRDVQAASLAPQLGANASAQRARSSNVGSNSFALGFDASWEPDIFGGVHAALNATEADAQAAAGNLGQVQVSLAAEVAATYVSLRSLQARLDIARTSLDTQADSLQMAR